MALSKKEREELKVSPQNPLAEKKEPASNKKILFYSLLSFVLVIVVIGISFGIVQAMQPGPLDDFAKCLAEEDAVMYGASFCKYSAAQKSMFGKSKKYLDYRDFSENGDVEVTPTWYIEGEKYENVQSLDKLSQLTGCTLPGREVADEG